MKCPACGNNLQQKTIENITVDVCEDGCGGIWFDLFELEKVDEKQESAGEALLHIPRKPGITVDHTQKRNCPKCTDIVMMRHFFSVKRSVVLDECPKCGGFWLDAGELNQIRNLFETEEERKKAAKKYFSEVCGPAFQQMKQKSEKDLRKTQKIAHMFRFICPSYYISGDQDWGAF